MPKLSAYHRGLSYSYAPGIFPSLSLLDARPDTVKRLLVHSSAVESEGTQALIARCRQLGVRMEIADHALAKISKKENCYAALVFEKYEDMLSAHMPHIVLYGPSDMGNVGTIMRTCLGFGLLDIAIIEPAVDFFDPRVIRASMGAVFSMRIARFPTYSLYRERFLAHALFPFMLDGSISLRKAAGLASSPYALVFGNEATGLPDCFAKVGQPVRIPHSDAIDSLNLAVAVSIAAYAFTEK